MIEDRLKELSISLPTPAPPAANYVPFVKAGSLVFVSGQLPLWEGTIKYLGKLGQDLTIEEGQEAARLCALHILTHLKTSCSGDLNKVKQCLRLGGFVNSIDTFKDHPKVLNGASDLMVAVFGEKGKHARAALGVSSLPLGSSVEVEALFEIHP